MWSQKRCEHDLEARAGNSAVTSRFQRVDLDGEETRTHDVKMGSELGKEPEGEPVSKACCLWRSASLC